MVKALHKAGIEVILDVVYNHTARPSAAAHLELPRPRQRRLLCARSCRQIALCRLHWLRQHAQRRHTVVRRLILDSLRYWAQEMHIDGFRFDWRRC